MTFDIGGLDVGAYRISPQLQAQVQAIIDLSRPLELIHGPPGTGKSTLISAVVESAVPRSMLTIVVSARNRAVSVIAEKVSKFSKFVKFHSHMLLRSSCNA